MDFFWLLFVTWEAKMSYQVFRFHIQVSDPIRSRVQEILYMAEKQFFGEFVFPSWCNDLVLASCFVGWQWICFCVFNRSVEWMEACPPQSSALLHLYVSGDFSKPDRTRSKLTSLSLHIIYTSHLVLCCLDVAVLFKNDFTSLYYSWPTAL